MVTKVAVKVAVARLEASKAAMVVVKAVVAMEVKRGRRTRRGSFQGTKRAE